MSRFHFHRTFKKATGVTPKAYAAALRAARVRAGLSAKLSVTQAIYDAGYSASGRFYETSAAVLGMTPTAFRDGGVGAAIQFAVRVCSLGHVLVAATVRGVCAISLGDDPRRLIDDLRQQLPHARIIDDDAEFESVVSIVVSFVDARAAELRLPLDVRGTVFQRRVWEALRAIPRGQTASYKEIATVLGMPQAARAVARACATNSLAIAIPCHRVVSQNGGLAGYRWGVDRKRALQDREQMAATSQDSPRRHSSGE